MPMPSWQDQPANRNYKRQLAELRIPLPRWWPGRMHADVVGGDLETGSIIVHLPIEGNPYLARVPAEGEPPGNTGITMAELDRNRTRYEWIEDDWKFVVFSSEFLSAEDIGLIKASMHATPSETSSRRAVFDPVDRGRFSLERQRFDWQLLQNGFVHRYGDLFGLNIACGHLADLDYRIHVLDASAWTGVGAMHTAFSDAFSFPSYYGRNLDALNDCLHDVAEYGYGSSPDAAGTVLAIASFDTILRLDRRTATVVLDIFAKRARLAALFGHAMLCLIDTTDNQLGKVGGIGVLRQTVSETPPDPPAPFDESSIIEFGFQVFATPAEAELYVRDLRAAIAPILDSVGRWHLKAPTLTSENEGQLDEEHSSSKRQRTLGQHLYDMTFAVRGRGDWHALSDDIFHAVTGAKLEFEQMYDTPTSGTRLPDALEEYPELELPM